MNRALIVPVIIALAFLTACASTPSGEDCPAGTQKLPDCPPLDAIEDPFITALYWRRAWQSGEDHEMDVVDKFSVFCYYFLFLTFHSLSQGFYCIKIF